MGCFIGLYLQVHALCYWPGAAGRDRSLGVGSRATGRELDGQGDPAQLSTGDPLGEPFLSLLTFSRGGTLVESTSNPMFFPAVRGDGHGVWSPTGRQTYRALSVAFITLNGALANTQTITQKIEMGADPNSFEVPSASVVLVPANGGSTITGCATATGTRIE